MTNEKEVLKKVDKKKRFLSRTRALYKVCFCGGRVVVACLSNVDW